MMRIFLFPATNLAVPVIASITLKLLGVDRYTGQNYGSLLVFCAVFGFAGSLISLFISKWMAKMSTRTEIISQPRTRHEQWLLQTVEQLSREAGIKMPGRYLPGLRGQRLRHRMESQRRTGSRQPGPARTFLPG